MSSFPQSVMYAQRELQDAIQAASRQPSSFAQLGAVPQAPAAPPQTPMMPPMMPVVPPQMAMTPPVAMPQQPAMPVQQFAKGGLAVWDRPAPEGKKSKPLSAKKKAAAKRRAKAAGRPYPNLVDNLAVRRK